MPRRNCISPSFKLKLERELSADEDVLWVEQPAPLFAKNVLLFFIFIIFLILWLVIDIFNVWSASLFALIILGVWALGTKIHFKKTLYVITNKRALIIQRARTYTIRSYPPHLLQFIYLTEKRMGVGDLIFEENISKRSNRSPKVQQFGFFNVRKVKLVEQMLRSLAEQDSKKKE